MMPEADSVWPTLPTETEIYILPDGEIVVADLPAELAAQLAQLTQNGPTEVEPIELANHSDHVSDQQHPTQPL
ncbi:MAG: hypothetical protein IT328_26060 [Caldilineaceae bacterium]|nr:hypothetical protein [Caldilineaceae bacterium]